MLFPSSTLDVNCGAVADIFSDTSRGRQSSRPPVSSPPQPRLPQQGCRTSPEESIVAPSTLGLDWLPARCPSLRHQCGRWPCAPCALRRRRGVFLYSGPGQPCILVVHTALARPCSPLFALSPPLVPQRRHGVVRRARLTRLRHVPLYWARRASVWSLWRRDGACSSAQHELIMALHMGSPSLSSLAIVLDGGSDLRSRCGCWMKKEII